MKSKLIIASLLLACTCSMANAQEKTKYYTDKGSDNIFVGVGVGGLAVINDGVNSPKLNFNISVGKYISPVWGVRGQIGGLWQGLNRENVKPGYNKTKKTFGELNLDAMLNLINLFGSYNPNNKFNLYLFGGPTMNLSSAVSATVLGAQEMKFEDKGLKARFGATVGLGLGVDVSEKWAVNLEGRLGVTPSIFGHASDCYKAEATARVNVGVVYTLGGKKFVAASNVDEDALNAEINRYRSELAKAQADLNDAKNALANVKPQVKEVTKEVAVAGPRAVFFKLGSARLDDYGKVNIQLAARLLKANTDKKYKVIGYADKATGSASWNQKLSEKRAQVVYDALIAEGVSSSQIEMVAEGGTDNMFGKNALNRVVIIE